MANDEPTNLRMGFGFVQARAAGAPYANPRPVRKVDWDLKIRQCERKLRDIIKNHPPVGGLVREIMGLRKSQGLPVCSSVELYHVVLFTRPKLAPPGYWEYAEREFGWLRPGHPWLSPQSKRDSA